MNEQSVSTSFDNLLHIAQKHFENGNPIPMNILVDTLTKITKPSKTGRNNMPKIDPILNKQFRIKRIGYEIIAHIESKDDKTSLYNARIKSITSGSSQYLKEGDILYISKRELEMRNISIPIR